MKKYFRLYKPFTFLLALSFLLTSCITYTYIRDAESLTLQKDIQSKRAGNVIGDTFLTLASAVVAAFTGVYVGYTPDGRSLKHLSLVNNSPDTMQVNLISDMKWKDSTYCDFRDIRIPPGKKCRLLVPVNSVYNLYFSNTMNSEEDDEFLEIDANAKSKIILSPGMTFQNETDTIQNIINPIK
jgi:hypothetical protein